MSYQMKGGVVAEDPRLGRVPEFDERSRNFRAVDLIGDHLTPVLRKTWRCDLKLDQGNTPSCVGHAWAHDEAADPKRRKASSELAHAWYKLAQQHDEWPGEDYGGTSTLGGAKAGVLLGRFTEYRWCFGLDDLLKTVAHLGPVIVGTWWYRSMFSPDAKGFIDILPGSPRDGGHEWLVRGVNFRDEYVTAHNSWGASWGIRGSFRVPFSVMDRLLREDGDACYPVR